MRSCSVTLETGLSLLTLSCLIKCNHWWKKLCPQRPTHFRGTSAAAKTPLTCVLPANTQNREVDFAHLSIFAGLSQPCLCEASDPDCSLQQ